MQFAAEIRKNQGTLTTGIIARQSRDEAPQIHTLGQGEVKTVQARPGLEVRSTSGTLWLTQQGEADDILLEAGQMWRASRAGRVVIQAIGTDANWTLRVPAQRGTITNRFRLSNASL